LEGVAVQSGVVHLVTNILEFKELGKATVRLSSIEIKNIKVAK
jgi:hypothetical protein